MTDLPREEWKTVYGPVRSWRFGNSLGIDPILVSSICSFNCIYCQLGEIQQVTTEQRIYVPTDRVVGDLKAVAMDDVDVVTISGSGEPTLALNLGEIIAHIKDEYGKPVMVLTNATLLHDEATRRRLYRADTVNCKLDAANDATLRKINRPAPGVSVDRILSGIQALRQSDFPGRVALQCMFMPANVKEARELAELIARINPQEVQLNTPRRPYPRSWYPESRGNHDGPAPVETLQLKTVTLEQAEEIEQIIRDANPGVEIVSVYRKAPES